MAAGGRIAQALVTIRPDLTGFAGLLRTDLEKQINLVGIQARTVFLTAKFAPGTQAALRADLKKAGPFRVEIDPIISQARLNALKAQLGTLPVNVAVQGQQAARQAQTVRPQTPVAVVNDAETVRIKQQAALQAAAAQAQLTALAKETEARKLLANVEASQGALLNTPAGTTAAAAIDLEKKALQDVANLEKARVLALDAGAAAVERNVVSTQEFAAATLAERTATVEAFQAEQARIPALREIERFNARIAAIQTSDLTLAQQKRALIQVENQVAQSIKIRTAATIQGNQADIASLEGIHLKVGGLREEAVAQIAAGKAAETAAAQAARAAAAQATLFSQAGRGATATGASFLGLRGAVLSASGGFLAATVAVTAFAKIIGTASQLQRSLNIFQSVSGATAEQMAAAAEEARQLGKDLSLPATSANDAAAAMTELSKAGLSVNDTFAATKGVLQLSAAAQLDVGSSANIVATELNAFGLAGDQATRVADLLAGASVAAQGDIQDFALAFQQVSAVAHQVNLPLETTTAILTQFAKAGLRGSDAGTSLRTMLLRLVPTTKAAQQAQEDLGIKIDRSIPIGEQFTSLVNQYTRALAKLGPVAQQESLTKIFGQDAIRGASISLTQGAAALGQVQQQVSEPGQAAKLSAAQMEGLSGSIEGLKSEIETFAGTTGTLLLPSLEAITDDLSAIVGAADEAVTELQKLAGIKIGPIGLGPVANLLGGADAFGSVALAAGIGVGIAKLRDFVVARRAAAAATKAAAAEAAAAEVAAQATVTAAIDKTVIAQQEVNAGYIKNATVAEESAAKQAASLSKVGAAIGLLTTIAGSALEGQGGGAAQAGSVVSSAGQGALIGSILKGGKGGIVGFGIGAAEGFLSNAKAEVERNKAKWNALTAAEQFSAISQMENGDAFLSVFGLTLKPIEATDQTQKAVARLLPSTLAPTANVPLFGQPAAPGAAGSTPLTAIKVDAQLQAQVQLAAAEASDNTAATTEALKTLQGLEEKQRDAILKQLDISVVQPGFVAGEKRVALQKQLLKIYQQLGQINKQIASAAKDAFSIPISVQIAQIQAGPTATLVDNLAAQNQVVDVTRKALEAELAKKTQDKKAIDDLRVKLATAEAEVATTQNSINTNAKTAAAQSVQDAETRLRIAADAAGNIGAAENKLIAFLRAQVNAESLTTEQQLAAQSALKAEIDKRKTALQAVVDASSELQDARLQTALSTAELTSSKSDDDAILNQMIAKDRRDIIRFQKLADSAGRTTAAGKRYLIAVQNELQDINGLKSKIKDLQGDSGFSLNDLFQEAVNQFNEFSSNVSSGPNGAGVTTAGGARAAVAGGILAQRPTDRLTAINADQLNEAAKTNVLLRDLLDAVTSNGLASNAESKSGTRFYDGFAGTKASEQARRLGKTVGPF